MTLSIFVWFYFLMFYYDVILEQKCLENISSIFQGASERHIRTWLTEAIPNRNPLLKNLRLTFKTLQATDCKDMQSLSRLLMLDQKFEPLFNLNFFYLYFLIYLVMTHNLSTSYFQWFIDYTYYWIETFKINCQVWNEESRMCSK